MERPGKTANSTVAGLTKAGSGVLKLVGVLLVVYVVGIAIYGVVQYSTTKSKLLTYGFSDATGSLVAWAVMLVAFGFPAFAVFRIFFLKGKPYHYAAAMVLPLISWGIAQVPANFDARTGEALKYCAKRPGGELFCLDRPGIDPLTKQPLVPMDAKLAERQFREGRGLVPKRITERVESIQFFDPLSDPNKPEPKVWVVKNDQGCYDLYDNPGVHPQTGEPLNPVTTETVRSILRCLKTAQSPTPPQPLAPNIPRTESKSDAPVVISNPYEKNTKDTTAPMAGMEFVWLPAGCFNMGCGAWTAECDDDEMPIHKVCVDGFWMGRTEVTQGQWKIIMGSPPPAFLGNQYPVEWVSWYQTQEFFRRLKEYTKWKFELRLPTEAEWEYACRSGGQSEKYAGSSNVAQVAWYRSNSGNALHPVSSKIPNGVGLYDMSGNVAEWCEDTYNRDAFRKHQRDNPVQSVGAYRMVRGGGFGFSARGVRCGNRYNNFDPGTGYGSVGFRIVRKP